MSEEVVATKKQNRLAEIPMSLVVESEVALRGVDRKDEQYQALVQSVRKNGVLEPILVREIEDASGVTRYGLINGLQRYTASKDSGFATIPAHIVDIEDADLMQKQIITNLHRVETKPAQYSVQLRRLISQNPLLTNQELADMLTCNVSWLSQRLSLTKLDKRIQGYVDDGQIGLANAYVLAKLPIDEQLEHVERAMTDASDVFTSTVASRLKEINEAKKQGREARPQEFEAIERVQPLSIIKNERKMPSVRDQVLAAMGATSVQEGWDAALAWATRMDPDSVAKQKADYDQKCAERAAAKERTKAEREKAKLEAAAAAQADLTRL